MSAVATWGSTSTERAESFPCDAYLEDAKVALFRAVTVHAEPAIVFRWLCQLRVAPYSYDWIDNGGRASPRELTPGLEELARGQRVMRIFELVDFVPGEHLTLLLTDRKGIRLFGEIVVTYRVTPSAEGSRLVAKMRIRSRPGFGRALRTSLLSAGDLVMMRKQLLTLKSLAEREQARQRA
jgi:hypothetical protein